MAPEVQAAFALYVQHRRELRKPLTPTAEKMALRKVEEYAGGNPRRAIAIINQSIESGWIGIFQLSKDNNDRFLANERERMRVKRVKCEYCNKDITEDSKWEHEDNECPNFRRIEPGKISDAVNQLVDKWKAN